MAAAPEDLSEAERRAYAGNIRKAYIYEAFTHFQLWIPIWVVYLQVERGLSLAQIALLDAPFFLTQVLTEVPTGSFADRFGRRASLAMGSGLLAIAVLVFGIAENFWLILVSYLFWGVASTFQSGADSALLYDSLKLVGRESEYTRIQGTMFAVVPAAGLLAGLLGAPLAEATSLATPIIMSSVIAAGGLFVALTMKEPPNTTGTLSYVENVREALRIAVSRPTVRYALLFGPLLGVSLMMTSIFTQPFLIGHGASIGSLGLFLVPIRLGAIAGSLLAYWAVQKLGQWPVFVATPFIVSLAFFGLAGWDSIQAFSFFAVLTFMNTFRNPILMQYINQRIPSGQRATILSLRPLLLGLLLFVFEPPIGLVAHELSLRVAFAVLGLLSLTMTLPVLVLWRRAHVREAQEESAGGVDLASEGDAGHGPVTELAEDDP
jgi:MFS family permease